MRYFSHISFSYLFVEKFHNFSFFFLLSGPGVVIMAGIQSPFSLSVLRGIRVLNQYQSSLNLLAY